MFPGNYKARYLEDGKDVSIPDDFYSSDFYTDRLLGYLERDRQPGKPFFAYLAFTAPHWPLQAPDQYLDRYRGNYADGYEALRRKRLARMIELGILPAGTRPNDPLADKLPTWEQLTEAQRREQTRIMQIYAAMVDNMDHNIGRVLDHLRKSGELDNTFVLFMSDNGPESASPESLGTTEDRNGIRDWVDATFDNSPRNMGRKGSYVTLGPGWAQVGATPFPYFKSFTAKGGIQVPAIVRYPAATSKGAISGEVLHVKDFVPTILALAGASYPAQYRGMPCCRYRDARCFPSCGQAQPERCSAGSSTVAAHCTKGNGRRRCRSRLTAMGAGNSMTWHATRPSATTWPRASRARSPSLPRTGMTTPGTMAWCLRRSATSTGR